MRLTLRTLLAYLDGNLEADDSKDIGKKIEESEFASRLVHLIRDCTRRLRLGAPPLIGRGLAADPNTVAEYLEYQLADERVPEFEKICLESEVHLAEVASCHQILTLVLGEPAEIDPASRERFYHLAAQAEAPPALVTTAQSAPQGTTAPPAAMPPAPPVRRPKPEIPDYLRESRWRWWPVAAVVLLAATLTFGGLLVFGPAELRERVTALVQSPPAEGEPQADAEQAAEPAEPPSELAAEATPAEDETPPSAEPAASEEPAVVMPDSTPPVDPNAPPAPEPDEPIGLEPPDATDATTPAAEPLPETPPGGDSETPPAAAPEEMPDGAAPVTAFPEPAEAAAPRQPPAGFGRYISQREVLLRFDPGSGDWARLTANSPLNAGDRLLSLPSFRPAITLSSNITIQADGPALLELVGWTDDGVPIVSVAFGRLLMATVGRANNALQLEVDGRRPTLTFVDGESTLDVEVRRDLPPGDDPQAGPLPVTADVYAMSGLIRVQDGSGDPVELQARAKRSLLDPGAPPADDRFPAWVTSDQQSKADQMAADHLDSYLAPNKPVRLQLLELADPQQTRQREVRSLAIRSLMYLGDFEPCVAAMNRENERFFWTDGMRELHAAVARSPETASQVRDAFANRRGADGASLYRMVWGYSPAQLKDGADRQLVEALGSDSLDVRVMSFETLHELTGATHGYRPDDQLVKRRTAQNAWKKQIGRITPRAEQPGG